METPLGKCDCINPESKVIIIRGIERLISEQDDAMKEIEAVREELSKTRTNPDGLINIYKREKLFLEDVKERVSRTSECR